MVFGCFLFLALLIVVLLKTGRQIRLFPSGDLVGWFRVFEVLVFFFVFFRNLL